MSADFAKVFKAAVGVEFANSETFTDSFEIMIPKNKQAEIWTWNDAKFYTFSFTSCSWFSCTTNNFMVVRPTNNFGHEIFIVDHRDPSGGA